MTQQIAAPVTGVGADELAGTVDGVTSVAGAAAGHDMSMISLFLHAEPLVLTIMLVLVFMSVACWAIIIEKHMSLRSTINKTNLFENEFWSADSLDKFYDRLKKRKAKHAIAIIFNAAMDEWLRSKQSDRVVRSSTAGDITISTKERIAQMMSVARNREIDRLERGLGFLATCGSSAPFIGLLGTCIGIMNAFRAIAGSQNTSLAVVAPGIAEALFATAIGLFVAIPAVIAYNKFNGEVNRLAGRFEDFSTEFHALLSRQTESRD
jgi:biopolymer transport protein TolQ